MVSRWVVGMKQRVVSVRMLHIGLNDRWRLIDIWFVITGRV